MLNLLVMSDGMTGLVGFLLGTIFGTLIASALWWSPFFSKVLAPFLVVLNSLPKVALGPIIIIWVGAGAKAIIAMALAISIIVTILEMLNGFIATDLSSCYDELSKCSLYCSFDRRTSGRGH